MLNYALDLEEYVYLYMLHTIMFNVMMQIPLYYMPYMHVMLAIPLSISWILYHIGQMNQ